MEKHRAHRHRGLDERNLGCRHPNYAMLTAHTYTSCHIKDITLDGLFTDKIIVFCVPPGSAQLLPEVGPLQCNQVKLEDEHGGFAWQT